ncbi:MAG TPA: preprotein translocase subunit SecA [Tissierellaceae bacterium]
MAGIFEKIFGTYSERELKKIQKIVDNILSLDSQMQKLTDEELSSKTEEFKNRLKQDETLDDILPEAYAVVREASSRILGMKHFPVQLMGGIILHQGRIAEMKTGEGKTLVATLPAYLNALTGKGVHVVTVNDYLAKRDMEWMGKLYSFLGLSVACIIHGISNEDRKRAYASDITYGTNNEFGFDYLRDNMVIYKEEMVQRPLNFAIVDEVDSILVDEARTPLIISGRGDDSTDLYAVADSFVKTLRGRVIDPEEAKVDPFDREIKEEVVDFLIDEKAKSVTLTDKGVAKAERYFSVDNLADIENMEISHHVNQALKANNIMKRDIDYVVNGGEVLIVDEFTGRLMQGRRYSNGLHQAIEAKENLQVKSESKTLATITFQNYFRMYEKLSGMTGTAMTEEEEFREIYGMDVVEIPTNKPVIRKDLPDEVYKDEKSKNEAVIREIKSLHEKGQPVLVGTITIEKSELLSKMLQREGIKHQVLNAKQHEKEAEIVSQAGKYKAVTIATNMAGRGTDIVLGGNPEHMAKTEMIKKGYSDALIQEVDSFLETDDEEILQARKMYHDLVAKYKVETDENARMVEEAGGLYIIGTERHESRRIDNQLRGRAGRQGDPGTSKFFISLEDDLMRLFGGERIQSLMESVDMPDGEPLAHPILSRTIEGAQKKVESNNFAIRKHVLKYDDVMNKQREVIYGERKRVLEGDNLKDHILGMVENLISSTIDLYSSGFEYPEEWNFESMENYFVMTFGLEKEFMSKLNLDIKSLTKEKLNDEILKLALEKYEQKEKEFTDERFREIERVVLLQVVDSKWMDHIDAMDQLKQGIGLRAYGNEDPVMAYQIEGFDMFEEMKYAIMEDTVKFLYNVEIEKNVERKRVASKIEEGPVKSNNNRVTSNQPIVKGEKIGRNDPCPCGSGKKYKKCCGK